jgi:hypothetical protein
MRFAVGSPSPVPRALGVKERREDLPEHVRCDAGAGVVERHPASAVGSPKRHLNHALALHRLRAVHEQVLEYNLQELGVGR